MVSALISMAMTTTEKNGGFQYFTIKKTEKNMTNQIAKRRCFIHCTNDKSALIATSSESFRKVKVYYIYITIHLNYQKLICIFGIYAVSPNQTYAIISWVIKIGSKSAQQIA